MISIVKRFYKNNPTEFWITVLILLLAAFLRFYRIDEYMSFLGDEGRDALMVKRILTEFDIPLIGPSTSIGNMYLGPLYYYMMTIPMAIFWLNPVAAAGMVATLGTATVGIIYYLSRIWFGRLAAILSAILFAISPVTIIYSRSSWNPNPASFFVLLAVLGLFKSHQTKNYRWLILVGVAIAFLIQMHYLALIFLPVVIIFWLLEYLKVRKSKVDTGFLKNTLIGVFLFLTLMSPLVVFDLKHDFMNYKAIMTFFTNRQETVNLNFLNSVGRTIPIYTNDLISRYMTGQNQIMGIGISLILLILIGFTFYKVYKKQGSWPLHFLSLWLLIGIFGLSLYKRSIFDHYLGFLAPAPYLLLGGLIYQLKDKLKIAVFVILLLSLSFLNFQKSPLLASPNRQLERTKLIAKFIIEKSENKPYNFALIAKNNYDPAYQFYLSIYNHPPSPVDTQPTDQLFVVCEDQECLPVGHPKYEIAAFGWTKIESEEDIQGIKVFKLIPNPKEDEVKNES